MTSDAAAMPRRRFARQGSICCDDVGLFRRDWLFLAFKRACERYFTTGLALAAGRGTAADTRDASIFSAMSDWQLLADFGSEVAHGVAASSPGGDWR